MGIGFRHYLPGITLSVVTVLCLTKALSNFGFELLISFFDWQQPFLLPRDEDKFHDYIQVLNSNFFREAQGPHYIYPAYIIPILLYQEIIIIRI